MAGAWAGPVGEWAGLLLPAVVEVPLGSCRGRRVPQGRRRGWGEGCHGGEGPGIQQWDQGEQRARPRWGSRPLTLDAARKGAPRGPRGPAEPRPDRPSGSRAPRVPPPFATPATRLLLEPAESRDGPSRPLPRAASPPPWFPAGGGGS